MAFHLLDANFRKRPGRYLIQCFIAAVTLGGILVFLDVLKHTALIASLGATAFTVFSMPSYIHGRETFAPGGYLVGLISGILCFYISRHYLASYILTQKAALILFASISVGLAIFSWG